MSAARVFFLGSIALFSGILVLGLAKKVSAKSKQPPKVEEIQLLNSYDEPLPPLAGDRPDFVGHAPTKVVEDSSFVRGSPTAPSFVALDPSKDQIDRMGLLFSPFGPRLPIVQTVRYTPKVQWVKDRPAWIVDYASHFQTSKHFISRSLTGKKDYFHYEINPGDRFNVLRNDIPFEFYLIVDVSHCKLRFYYIEPLKKEMTLLKGYAVTLGRRDEMSPSGCLTPLGKYKLGPRIAVYKPGMVGTFRKQKTEMVQIFGTRWIPFEEEVGGCTAPARGYGIHGQPWQKSADGQWHESTEVSNPYSSDGCIRLATEDMEELFSIIVTRPTTIEIVKSFEQSTVDAKEVEPVIIMNP